jgi:hypothetical protein
MPKMYYLYSSSFNLPATYISKGVVTWCDFVFHLIFHTIFQLTFVNNCIVWTQKSNVESWIEASFQNRLTSFFLLMWIVQREIKNCIKIEWKIGKYEYEAIQLTCATDSESFGNQSENCMVWLHLNKAIKHVGLYI